MFVRALQDIRKDTEINIAYFGTGTYLERTKQTHWFPKCLCSRCEADRLLPDQVHELRNGLIQVPADNEAQMERSMNSSHTRQSFVGAIEDSIRKLEATYGQDDVLKPEIAMLLNECLCPYFMISFQKLHGRQKQQAKISAIAASRRCLEALGAELCVSPGEHDIPLRKLPQIDLDEGFIACARLSFLFKQAGDLKQSIAWTNAARSINDVRFGPGLMEVKNPLIDSDLSA